jgi:hypothetical protein
VVLAATHASVEKHISIERLKRYASAEEDTVRSAVAVPNIGRSSAAGPDSGDNCESMGWILENTVMLRTFYKSH